MQGEMKISAFGEHGARFLHVLISIMAGIPGSIAFAVWPDETGLTVQGDRLLSE